MNLGYNTHNKKHVSSNITVFVECNEEEMEVIWSLFKEEFDRLIK